MKAEIMHCTRNMTINEINCVCTDNIEFNIENAKIEKRLGESVFEASRKVFF